MVRQAHHERIFCHCEPYQGRGNLMHNLPKLPCEEIASSARLACLPGRATLRLLAMTAALNGEKNRDEPAALADVDDRIGGTAADEGNPAACRRNA